MEYLFSTLIGYLLGSFPTAYLLLKKHSGIDIRTSGTGNVGAMNSFEVTNSKFIGILVLLIDALKGLLSVYIILIIYPGSFLLCSISLLAAVYSHCYNPWLKFKGGRGLATGAGGTALLFPFVLILWLIIWTIVYLMKKNIHFANIWSSIMCLIIVFTSSDIAAKYTYPPSAGVGFVILFSMGLFIIILTKHIEPLIELIENPTILKRKKEDE